MSEQTDTHQLVVFALAGEQYALPIQKVHEIIRYVEPRTVSSDSDWVRGVISLRGRIVPVYDLATHLGLVAENRDESNIAIVETGTDTVGLIVDHVEEVLTIDSAQLEHVPVAGTELIDSIAKIDDRLVVLIDPGTITAEAA
jgi:purine-binding chemotaxis protein CheW